MAMSHSIKDVPSSIMRIGNATLEWVKSYTYLGILINANGDFLSTSENLCVRGWKASFKIKSAKEEKWIKVNKFDKVLPIKQKRLNIQINTIF